MRILIADDHDLVRDTMAFYLLREGAQDVIGASDLPLAIQAVATHPPFDIILLDYAMPGMDGLGGLSRMRLAAGSVPVTLFSGRLTPSLAQSAVASGAAGVIPKSLKPQSLYAALHLMIAGECFLPFELTVAGPGTPDPNLTQRELDVLTGLGQGWSNKRIAAALGLQDVTVKSYVRSLCRKLGAHNRTHAALTARARDLI
ncbi:hypothetical protein ACMU_07845 [Actibacterium mucosum KCTC 23349]|uniref:Chemotaxis protein CheY n=1 Tax=Actibacterium mucosum KCTC 23349 TaxID=1454373 RepID=A0A037ZPT1_9RHOB|nr:response regulator transcription factor [Actibacterium mucosum]KAJ56842.1 hypothetical protein ACMU_07845 [Actibacterium mucosum KCTC 23349]